MSIYQCNAKTQNFYFCPKCGVRCFTFRGVGEIVTINSADLSLPPSITSKDGKIQVWQTKWDEANEEIPYVSVNGVTIEPREDFDLAVLTEQKRVQYCECSPTFIFLSQLV